MPKEIRWHIFAEYVSFQNSLFSLAQGKKRKKRFRTGNKEGVKVRIAFGAGGIENAAFLLCHWGKAKTKRISRLNQKCYRGMKTNGFFL